MQIFKTRDFARWAKKMKLSNSKLVSVITEMEQGLIDAELGKHLYKKRIALQNAGKRGGVRTIIAYKDQDKSYFIYGFSKNEKENISPAEKEAFRKYANLLINMNSKQLHNAIVGGEIIEVNHE
jgi:hypothetical protein